MSALNRQSILDALQELSRRLAEHGTQAELLFRLSRALAVVLVAGIAMTLADRSAGATTVPANAQKNPETAHWAFQPLRKVDPPAVKNRKWPKTPIDRFILKKLEDHGLSPAPAADKRTLIRRANFDLIGLPPTPEEVDAFVADASPDAFSRVVERLLNSPHYGERWGRHWLDVARYADNKGYVFFEEKNYPWAWTYRDYVVRAFNDDKPFDRFLLEQIAADQLDIKGDSRTLAALGFLTVGDHFSNNTHDILDDRIDVVCRGLLGLTVGCARCHNHKFDPISQADYYSLYGVFRSCTEPMAPPVVESPAPREAYEGFELELLAREHKLREYVETKHREIVRDARTRLADYLNAVYAQRNQPPTESFMLITDRGDLNPTVIARWRAYLDRAGPTNAMWAPWLRFAKLDETNFAALAPGVHSSLLEASQGSAGFRLNPLVLASFSNAPPKSMKEVANCYAAVLDSADRQWQDALSNAVVHSQPAPRQLADPAVEELRQVLYGPDAPPDVPAQMDWGFLSLLPDRASQGEFQKLLKDLEQWLMHGPEAPARAMVLADLPVPYQPHIFQRGNPNRPGEPVPRRFVQVLGPRLLSQGSGRLDLAEAIVDPKNPLTARVFANRVWLHHFGAGLISTPSDFGTRSEPPSHPELLDWLAGEFVRSGWQVKELHRLIMKSAVYLQSSQYSVISNQSPPPGASPSNRSPDNWKLNTDYFTKSSAIDPENRLLSHANRRRHDFETQRDALLAVAGTLDAKSGGPPVPLTTPRRTLYTFVNRMDVPPLMTTFDFPSPSTSCPQRAHTTVAPQALYLMNNEFVADCAAAILRRSDVGEARFNDSEGGAPLRTAFQPSCGGVRFAASRGIPRLVTRRTEVAALCASAPDGERVRVCGLMVIMNPKEHLLSWHSALTRRQMLAHCGTGFGMMALASFLDDADWFTPRAKAAGSASLPSTPRAPHFMPRAKRVVHLFMNGGPSQVDTFDPKLALDRYHGQPLPLANLRTERKTGAAMRSPFKFQRYGQSGIEVSELFAKTASLHIDDMAIIRSMQAEVPNHEPSLMLMNCGDSRLLRPSMGSWITYGLGTENQNLPGFIVLCPGGYPIVSTQNWRSAFLPGAFQGTYIDTQHTDIEKLIANIHNKRMSVPEQRRQLDLVRALNEEHSADRNHDPQLEARLATFELAYRMQTEATDAFDAGKEPEEIRRAYGNGTHGRQLLIARRLLERGVRFLQVWSGDGQPWDNHENLEKDHRRLAGQWDHPIAAFLADLKQRGLFDDTLVLWSGEFGRTPVAELPALSGRDHNHYGFSVWLAGGGVRGGTVYGATDEFGFQAVENPVHVHDLHATILHLLGLDHERLTYRYAGRDFRLTDVAGNVVKAILA